MKSPRPSFEKKELAFSSAPFAYIPGDIPVYTVEVTHRDPVDGELLQRALNRTLQRMPYLSDTLVIDHGAVYYAKNPLPMEAVHLAGIRPVGGSETNYHMLDLTWDGRKTWFSMYHGFCDGQGISAFLESVLYHYYCMKDGVEYDPCGIRSDSTQMTEAETFDPYSMQYEVSPDFVMPQPREEPVPYHLPELVPNTSGPILDYGFRLPSADFMRFVKANGTSPSIMLAMLVDEAIRRQHPDADAPVSAIIPISLRRFLGCEETFKNCSDRITLPMSGTPMDALPFDHRAARLRGIMKQKMNPDLFRAINNAAGQMYRARMEQATDYLEELKKLPKFATVSHDTFYIDYIGSMHKTAYADQMTDIRFLSRPARGNTLHLNMIEHGGEFRVDFLSMCEIPGIIEALEQVLHDHGLTFTSIPLQRFTLPVCAWREGILPV